MKKRMLAMVLTMAVTAAGLSGCGGSQNGAVQNSTAEGAKTETAGSVGSGTTGSEAEGAQDTLAKPKSRVLTAAIADQEHEDRLGMVQPIANNDAMRGIMPGIENLFHYNDGKVEGWLIDTWTVSEDGMVYDWHVREGVKFHDGSDLTAEVVKWNLQYALDNGVTAVSIKDMEVVDDHNLRVTLDEKNPLFLDTLATGLFGFVYSKEAFDKNGEEWCYKNPVGTGAYKFDSWDQGTQVVWTANEDYWGDGPYLDGITFKWFESKATAIASYINGDVQVLFNSDIDIFKEVSSSLSEQDAEQVLSNVPNNIFYIWMDGNDPKSPFHDVRVRQAACYAVDTDAIVNDLFEGFRRKTTNQPSYEGSIYYNPDITGYDYNPERAKELLAEAGYADGFTYTIQCRSGSPYDVYIPAVQAYLAAVGINLNVSYLEGTAFNAVMYESFAGTLFTNPASFAPNEFGRMRERFSRGNIESFGYKDIYFSDAYFDYFEQAKAANTAEEAAEYYKKAMKEAIDIDCSFMVLYADHSCTMKYNFVEDSGVDVAPNNQWFPSGVKFSE